MNLCLKGFFAVLFSVGSVSWAAMPKENYNTVDVASSFVVTQGQTETISLSETVFVQKLLIQAEGAGSGDAYAQVIVNGDVKGTIYAPGRDPHYVVTVAEVTKSIQIVSTQNSLRILDVKAVVSNTRGPISTPLPNGYYSTMGKLASDVMWTVNSLEGYTDYRDFGRFLLPIRKVAALTIAIAEARGDISFSARPTFLALLDSIDYAAPYLDNYIERDQAGPLVMRLMSLREHLRAMLR